MAEKETKKLNEDVNLDENTSESTVSIELDEDYDVENIGFVSSEELEESFENEDVIMDDSNNSELVYEELANELEDINNEIPTHVYADSLPDEEYQELLEDIKEAFTTAHDFDDSSLDDAVSHEDILSATDELLDEISNAMKDENEMKNSLSDEFDDLDDSDLPDWDSDDEDWVDDLELGDDWDSDVEHPFGDELTSDLGRFGRLRRSSFFNNTDLDDNSDDKLNAFIPTQPNESSDVQKSGIENLKSHMEDKIECVGKKIIENKSLIASSVIGTVAVMGSFIVYKLFKNKSK